MDNIISCKLCNGAFEKRHISIPKSIPKQYVDCRHIKDPGLGQCVGGFLMFATIKEPEYEEYCICAKCINKLYNKLSE